VSVCTAIPGFGLVAKGDDIPDPAFSEALAAEKDNLDLGLVEPTPLKQSIKQRRSGTWRDYL